MPLRVTRLAPSPTGALHLGNARTFLINWALARQLHWKIVLRIEDLDTPRVKPQAQQQAIDDLRWLGINWDEGPLYQMQDLSPYVQAVRVLHSGGRVYPCSCTRSEIAMAQSAPNLGDHETRYPGTCRSELGEMLRYPGENDVEQAIERLLQPSNASTSAIQALRLLIPDEAMKFTDMVAGEQSIDVQQQVGDFIIATKANLPTYQLAVVVDDARQGITDIVRGDDLIPSAARQLWLYRFLNLSPLPRYWHLPLVVGEDGRRLAKRHGDTRLSWYRNQGVPAERIIGWVAQTCGILDTARPMSAPEFASCFDIQRMDRKPVIFTQEDHQWLMGA